MKDTERLAVTALVSAFVLVVPGFLLHEAPRFAGSLAGSLLGIAAALLFLLLLLYSLAKRSAWARDLATRHASLRALLSFHIYAGVVGALLAILHSGHRYESLVGILLVCAMLVVVLSGFAGRYYLVQLGTDVRDQQVALGLLRTRYDRLAAGIPGSGGAGAAGAAAREGSGEVTRLVGGIADLEHSIARRDRIKLALSRCTVVHVAAALVLYPLLVLHIWNGIYFGLRWLP